MKVWGIWNVNAENFHRKYGRALLFTTPESAQNAIMELKLNPKIYVVREFRR